MPWQKEITQKATGYVDRFIESLPSSPGFTHGECKKLKTLGIGEHGKPFDELLDYLEDEVDAIGINSEALNDQIRLFLILIKRCSFLTSRELYWSKTGKPC